jgi:hypothetical protein
VSFSGRGEARRARGLAAGSDGDRTSVASLSRIDRTRTREKRHVHSRCTVRACAEYPTGQISKRVKRAIIPNQPRISGRTIRRHPALRCGILPVSPIFRRRVRQKESALLFSCSFSLLAANCSERLSPRGSNASSSYASPPVCAARSLFSGKRASDSSRRRGEALAGRGTPLPTGVRAARSAP